MCVFILLNSNEDQKILYTQANQFTYIILLQEEPEMEEIQPHLHGAHEADYETPGETFTAG